MAGLESYVGRPKNPHILQCMRDEHLKCLNSTIEFSPSNNPQLTTTPAEEWMFVVDPTAYLEQAVAKNRFLLDRRVVTIEELMQVDDCVKAGLKEPEVVAARLYTGPMFKLYNEVLRNPPGPGHQSFVYTIHAFASCIVKLSRVHKITTLYRGIKGGALPTTFLSPDQYGSRGGVEYGFMSTTTERHVAYDYATAKDGTQNKAAVIYEIDEGAVDRGADVSWLSQFPTENEVVFPPLTNLEVFGEPKSVDGAIVTKLRVNINLRTMTVDEIVEKSRTEFLHMLDWYMEEVRTADLGFDPYQVLPTWLEDFTVFKAAITSMEGTLFNQHEFYRKAVDDALDLKEGTVQRVRVLKVLGEMRREDLHDAAIFARTIARLRATRASTFADSKFVMRYVALLKGSWDNDGNVQMGNYPLLWKLPIQKGSWAELVRDGNVADPICVSTRKTWAQALRDVVFSFDFIKGLWRQLLSFVVVDALMGFDGVYYCMGTTENGKPFYQLSKRDASLSCKYVYFHGTRWYIGSAIDSDWGDMQSMSENDELPTDVQEWGMTTAPALLAFVVATHSYVLDPSTKICRVDCGGTDAFGVHGDAEDQTSNAQSHCEASAPRIIMNAMHASTTVGGGDSRGSIFNDGQKWAFVHRMMEESQHNEEGGGGGRGRRGTIQSGPSGPTECSGNVGALQVPLGDAVPLALGKSELRSIAAYCEQTKCPMPKEVSSHLRDDGTNAALATALLTIAVCASLGIGMILLLFLGLDNFDLLHLVDFETILWFARGHIFACAVIGFVFWSMLVVALRGWSMVAAGGVVGVLVLCGSLMFLVILMGDYLVDNVVGGSIAFAMDGLGVIYLCVVLFGFLVR